MGTAAGGTAEEKKRREDKNLAEAMKRGTLDSVQMHGLLIDAQQEVARLKAQLAGVVKATGVKSEAEQAITLQQCLEHFAAHTSCKSVEAKDEELIRRVTAAVTLIGKDIRHSEVTKRMIDKAVNGSDYSVSEKPRILKEAKRFFRELSYPKAGDGLGHKSASPSRSKLRSAGISYPTDPRPRSWKTRSSRFTRKLSSPPFALGASGLPKRRALNGKRIDDGIIKVRATALYPKLKSEISERDVRPFDDLFPWLNKLKAKQRGDGLLFPRVNARRKRGEKAKRVQHPTWFRMYKGRPKAADLSGALADALNKARKPGEPEFKEPARRLRRFWETSMRERGLGHLIQAMGWGMMTQSG